MSDFYLRYDANQNAQKIIRAHAEKKSMEYLDLLHVLVYAAIDDTDAAIEQSFSEGRETNHIVRLIEYGLVANIKVDGKKTVYVYITQV